MPESKNNFAVMMWRILPIALLVGVRLFSHWKSGYLANVWGAEVGLTIGYVLGWLLVGADHFFYASVSNPHELTSQLIKKELQNKNWKRALAILRETGGEKVKLPIRNILSAFVMTGVGLWMSGSGGNLLAIGTCLGLTVRLYSEIIMDKEYQKWYWVFARPFNESEHKGLLMAWGLVLMWQWSMLARG